MGWWEAPRFGQAGPDSWGPDCPHGARGPPLRLYLDTSALLKIYVDEDGSRLVRESLVDAAVVATSLVTYVEAHAALARRHRAGDLAAADHRRVLRDLESDWERYLRVEVTEDLARDAAALASAHRLRAYDAIHLASAKVLSVRLSDETTFASWDQELDAAAAREGLRLLRPQGR